VVKIQLCSHDVVLCWVTLWIGDRYVHCHFVTCCVLCFFWCNGYYYSFYSVWQTWAEFVIL